MIKAFKLFRTRKDGTLGPLFINMRLRIEPGAWYEAEDHPTKGFAHRPGWHCGDTPEAPHLSEEGRVWYEVEIEGKKIKLFTWTTDNTAAGIVRDGNNHAFIQIYYGMGMETSFNEILLKKGYARVDREYLPDELHHYLELEKEAREKERQRLMALIAAQKQEVKKYIEQGKRQLMTDDPGNARISF